MIRFKWFFAASLVLAVGPALRAQYPPNWNDGWRGQGGRRASPGARPLGPGGGFGPTTMGDLYPEVFGGAPGLQPRPTSPLGRYGPFGPGGPAPGPLSTSPPKISPEMMQALSGGMRPPVLPALPPFTPPPAAQPHGPPPAAQPQGPPVWFHWWYVLAVAGASAVAGLLYNLLRRKPAA
jgi:hypothetical protein